MTNFSFASYARGLQRAGLAREIEASNRRLLSLVQSYYGDIGPDHALAARADSSDPHSALIVSNVPLAMTLMGR
jgi:hypothetical protein